MNLGLGLVGVLTKTMDLPRRRKGLVRYITFHHTDRQMADIKMPFIAVPSVYAFIVLVKSRAVWREVKIAERRDFSRRDPVLR